MKNTTAKTFRAELKDYLELAAKEPIRIQRRSGETFILINEKTFDEMKNEIISLQRRLLGATDALAGNSNEYVPGDKSHLNRFENKG